MRGKDYKCSTYMMVQQIRNAAGRPKYRCKVQIDVVGDEKGIVINTLSHHDGKPGPLPLPTPKPKRSEDDE